MKVALLADVHGNVHALDAVLAAMRAEGVQKVLCAGDLVGYYYDIAQALERLEPWDWVAVGGNHEDMLRQWRAGEGRAEIEKKYGSSLARACDRLDAAQLDFLTALPPRRDMSIAGKSVLLCHGAPWDRDAYVYPDAPAAVRQKYFDEPADLMVFGHTHYPVIWRDGARLAVNPGSVGQPRDRKPGACWALWDAQSGDVQLRREAYDVGPLLALCARHDPQLPYLADVLTRTS